MSPFTTFVDSEQSAWIPRLIWIYYDRQLFTEGFEIFRLFALIYISLYWFSCSATTTLLICTKWLFFLMPCSFWLLHVQGRSLYPFFLDSFGGHTSCTHTPELLTHKTDMTRDIILCVALGFVIVAAVPLIRGQWISRLYESRPSGFRDLWRSRSLCILAQND